MGRKEVQITAAEAVAQATEDSPVVTELKGLDDKYLALEREYEKELLAIQQKFTAMQQPFLEQRAEFLQKADEATTPQTGTPVLPGFWVKALKHHPAVADMIESYDVPVLEFLKDITKEDLENTGSKRGFKLNFHFAENPYFSHSVLSKEYHSEEANPYNGEFSTVRIDSTEVEWNAGKDVTVEKTAAPKAKKGAKKPAKASVEPRPSFFRFFFRTWERGMELPEDANIDPDDLDEDDDEEEIVQMLMDQDEEVGVAIRDHVVAFAVRWYTGEACPEDDDAEGCESEDAEDEEEEESCDESDEAPAAKGKGNKATAKAGAAPAEQPECKQQ